GTHIAPIWRVCIAGVDAVTRKDGQCTAPVPVLLSGEPGIDFVFGIVGGLAFDEVTAQLNRQEPRFAHMVSIAGVDVAYPDGSVGLAVKFFLPSIRSSGLVYF